MLCILTPATQLPPPPAQGLGYFDQQLALAHGVLSFWGRGVHVLSSDLDEFLVPATPGDTVPSMLATGCLSRQPACARFEGRAVYPHAQGAPPADEAEWWAADGEGIPLARYKFGTPRGGMHKSMADPGRTFPMSVHFITSCTGEGEVAGNASTAKLRSPCTERAPCAAADVACAWTAHVINMHVSRYQPEEATPLPRNWLWMWPPATAADKPSGGSNHGGSGGDEGAGGG